MIDLEAMRRRIADATHIATCDVALMCDEIEALRETVAIEQKRAIDLRRDYAVALAQRDAYRDVLVIAAGRRG